MSAPIRPLPVEAAPQRTECDPTKSLNSQSAVFGEILDSHLSSKEDEPDRKSPEKPARARHEPADPWSLFGIAPSAAPPPPAPPNAPERASVSVPSGARLEGEPESPSSLAPEIDAAGTSEETSWVQRLSPATQQQNLPSFKPTKEAELAGSLPKVGGKLDGTAAAKQPDMLLNVKFQNKESSEEQHSVSFRPSIEIIDSELVPSRIPRFIKPADAFAERQTENPGLHMDFSAADHLGTLPTDAPVSETSDIQRTPLIQGVHDQVHLLKLSHRNEIQIVLRPDSQTEIFLQVRRIDGQLHVQARCDRGDFAWLDSQWNAVQSSLEAQGVRVEPLHNSARSENQTHSGFMNNPGGSPKEHRANASIDFPQQDTSPKKDSSRPAARSAANPSRGWQSWA